MEDSNFKLLIAAMVLIVIGAVGWVYRDQLFGEPPPEPVAEAPAPVEPTPDEGPRYPLPEPESATSTGEPKEPEPLPSLADSDAGFLLAVAATLGPGLESLLVREAVIDKLVATIDNLPRKQIADHIRPVGQLDESFHPDSGDDDSDVLGFSSTARFDALVAQIYYADVDTVYAIYRRYYPLFQEAYEQLGYPDAYFNDRLVEVIDHLLATPEPDGAIVLTRPKVLYEFADPELEGLSSGQKLLLRMGSDNAATLKRILEKFRDRLLAGN